MKAKSHVFTFPNGLEIHRYGGSVKRMRGRFVLIDRAGYVITTKSAARKMNGITRGVNWDGLAENGRRIMETPL